MNGWNADVSCLKGAKYYNEPVITVIMTRELKSSDAFETVFAPLNIMKRFVKRELDKHT